MQAAEDSAASEDRDVVELLQSGNRDGAFALLLPRYERKIFRLCCALLRDQALAQDVTQESLVRIWKGLPRYDGRAALSSWIYTISRNRCLSALERRRAIGANLEGDAELESIAAAEPDPHQSEDRATRLRQLVAFLPERYRRTLTLFYFEDRSVAEVASLLGSPEGTIKTTLFRARAALAEALKEHGLDDPDLWLEAGT
jgi:RNA polymerase sigma-70 factor (ECF subfamily)